jgi:hypothetical protein
VSSFGIALSSWLLPPACIAERVMVAMPMIATHVFTRLRHDRPLRRPVETPETAT